MKPKHKQYLQELGGSLALYFVLLFASNALLRSQHLTGAAGYFVALLPMTAVAACAWAILRHVRRMDELQQRMELESLTFAFAITAFGTFAWGFVESAGAPKLPTFLIWPIMAALWVIGGLIARRRHYG